MTFITIGQYFYKLFNFLFLMLLVPIFILVAAYLQSPEPLALIPQPGSLMVIFAVLTAADWIVVFVLFSKKIKSIRQRQGLRSKLEKYFRLTIVRYSVIASGSLLLAIGFFITKEDAVIGLFTLNLILSGFLWPTSAKICSDLKLRGDEREMVYYRKDTL